MRVAICIPCYGDTRALFTQSLGSMLIWSLSQDVIHNGLPTKPQLEQMMIPGCARVDLAREQLAEDALRHHVDYLLWLDADQTFPSNTLFRLIAHDLPFVGCNYRKRTTEPRWTASNVQHGKYVQIEPKPDGIEAVDRIGFGVCLTKPEVFAAIERPWFRFTEEGEDGYFCQKAADAGFRPHVDHGLSREIGHVGQAVFTLDV